MPMKAWGHFVWHRGKYQKVNTLHGRRNIMKQGNMLAVCIKTYSSFYICIAAVWIIVMKSLMLWVVVLLYIYLNWSQITLGVWRNWAELAPFGSYCYWRQTSRWRPRNYLQFGKGEPAYSENVCMATVSVYHHRLTSRFGCWLETSKVWWLQ